MGGIDPDTQERHDTLLHGEKQLQNGHRNDPETLNTQVLILSKCARVTMVKVDEIHRTCAARSKAKPHPINWPTAGIVCGIIFGIMKMLS